MRRTTHVRAVKLPIDGGIVPLRRRKLKESLLNTITFTAPRWQNGAICMGGCVRGVVEKHETYCNNVRLPTLGGMVPVMGVSSNCNTLCNGKDRTATTRNHNAIAPSSSTGAPLTLAAPGCRLRLEACR